MNVSSWWAWSCSVRSIAAVCSARAIQPTMSDGSRVPAEALNANSSARMPLWMSR